MLATVTLGFSFHMEDGTTIKKDIAIVNQLEKWSVWFACVTLNKLLSLDPALTAQLVVSFYVSINGDGIPFIGPYKYEIDYRSYYKTYTLLYRSSLGSVESIVLRGQVDFQSDYTREQATRTVPPSYYENLNLLPQTIDDNSSETSSLKADTGFMSQSALEKLRDLFLSEQRFELLNNRFLPITFSGNSAKWYSNKDNLYSAQIEWSRAFVNNYFTPENLIPVNNACPSVETFAVRQISNGILQIMYSLPAPYERVQITIDDGYGLSYFRYTGNTRSIRQPFDLSQVASIIATAQVLCDEDSNPISAGPVRATNTIAINNNLAPIANNDTISISSGYNSLVTLPGSVLDNDYDPDNGTITAIAISGSTNAGGSYDIDGAGIVQYRPPTSSYTGQDFFDYTIEDNQGTQATARVFINVGAAVQVYAKLVIDSQTSNSYSGLGQPYDQKTTTTGKVYLRFYRDAAATTPIDVTNMGISANVMLKQTTKQFFKNASSVTSNIAVPCSSYTSSVYEGELYYKHSQETLNYGIDYELRQKEYSLQPGTGYVVL